MTLSPPLQQVDRTYVRHQGRKLSYFAGCDYFRLASHPEVLEAAATGLERFGLNVSASRMTTGNHPLYEQLERSIAFFFGAPTATLASNGYAPNLMVAQALAGQFSHALIDERAHGCLTDAAQLLDCPVVKFRHRDATDLARIVQRLGNISPLVLTDGMFSHDGSIAPLKEYLAALPAGGMILLDDAHGAGVLGKTGRGTPELAGISTKRIIQTITLSKGFGVYGGAVLGPRQLRSSILAKSRMFVGNTPLPLPLASAAIKSIAILKSDKKLRARLAQNTAWLKGELKRHGLPVMETPSPIFALVPQSAKEAERVKKRLLTRGIYPPFIKYPGGPESGYFRFAISSEHTAKQLDNLVKALTGR
jgi:7-keto-8-aminopelargonate synthetase-like enzyme